MIAIRLPPVIPDFLYFEVPIVPNNKINIPAIRSIIRLKSDLISFGFKSIKNTTIVATTINSPSTFTMKSPIYLKQVLLKNVFIIVDFIYHHQYCDIHKNSQEFITIKQRIT